jgi:hypothetical protein
MNNNFKIPMSIATEENGWINTVDTLNPQVLERVLQILQHTRFCTLSTCSADGIPWASPVFFCYQGLNLYWSSAIASRHSQNIYQNQGRVAIAIYDSNVAEGQAQGLYFSGVASELAPDHVGGVMQLLFKRAGGDPPDRTEADYLGDSPRRIYHFRYQEAWITGERLPIGKQLVDTKIRLDLDILTEA